MNINELAESLQVSTSVLRKWEGFFSIKVERNEKGNRKYTNFTIQIFQNIKNLVTQGKKLNEIKQLLFMDNASCTNAYNQASKIELIQDEPQENKNFDLVIKPFTERITTLEKLNVSLMDENKQLIRENATFEERVKNKDEIITFLQERLNRLESKKWYQVWK